MADPASPSASDPGSSSCDSTASPPDPHYRVPDLQNRLPDTAQHYINNIHTKEVIALDTNPNGEPFLDPIIFQFVEIPRSVWGITVHSNITTETLWWVQSNVNFRFLGNPDLAGDERLVHLYYGSRVARGCGVDFFYLDGERFDVRTLNLDSWDQLKRRIASDNAVPDAADVAVDTPDLPVSLDDLSLEDPLPEEDISLSELDTAHQEEDSRSVSSDPTGESTIWWPGYPRDSLANRRRSDSLQ